jgi:hypothetical protein
MSMGSTSNGKRQVAPAKSQRAFCQVTSWFAGISASLPGHTAEIQAGASSSGNAMRFNGYLQSIDLLP